jgi:hypothetical protein
MCLGRREVVRMPLIEDVALDQELERFERDMAWIYVHYQELKREHPNEYVAVYRGEVVGHSPDVDGLVHELRERYGDKAGEIAVKFVYAEPPKMILRSSIW